MRISKAVLYIGIVITAASALIIYEVDIDGSILGELWHIVRGEHIDQGLTVTVPRTWIGLHPDNKARLVHMAGNKTAEVFLSTHAIDDGAGWERILTNWVQMREADYVAEGYEIASPTTIYVLGQLAVCVKATSKRKATETNIECTVPEPQRVILATYRGPERDVPSFVDILASVRTELGPARPPK